MKQFEIQSLLNEIGNEEKLYNDKLENNARYDDVKITSLQNKILSRRKQEIEYELEARKKFNDEMRQINMLKSLIQQEGKPISKVQIDILSDYFDNMEN